MKVKEVLHCVAEHGLLGPLALKKFSGTYVEIRKDLSTSLVFLFVIHLIRPVGLVASSPALVRSRRLLRCFLRIGTGRDFRGVVVVVLGL